MSYESGITPKNILPISESEFNTWIKEECFVEREQQTTQLNPVVDSIFSRFVYWLFGNLTAVRVADDNNIGKTKLIYLSLPALDTWRKNNPEASYTEKASSKKELVKSIASHIAEKSALKVINSKLGLDEIIRLKRENQEIPSKFFHEKPGFSERELNVLAKAIIEKNGHLGPYSMPHEATRGHVIQAIQLPEEREDEPQLIRSLRILKMIVKDPACNVNAGIESLRK